MGARSQEITRVDTRAKFMVKQWKQRAGEQDLMYGYLDENLKTMAENRADF